MKTIHFVTPTLLSYIDLMSMGGSEKADDDTKIGTYCSGLKFSMALAHRNNVKIGITVYDTEDIFEDVEGMNRDRKTEYTVGTYTERCGQTGKEKELLQLTKTVSDPRFFSLNSVEPISQEIIPTGFSTKLGIDWSLWMLLREIYSNMVDEGGEYHEISCPIVNYGTVVSLSFEEGSEFDEIWNNRHLYINEEEPLYVISPSVDVLANEEGYLRIYKQNILVYEDKEIPSRFAYNVRFGSIDEKRILSDAYCVEGDIVNAIKNTKNEEYLREIIDSTFHCAEKEFLSSRSTYGSASDLIHDIACEIYEECGEVKSYSWVINLIKEREDCKIAGKKLKSVGDSIWAYSTTVEVQSAPETFSTPEVIETEEEVFEDSFVAEIRKHYNFDLDVEVKMAKLKGSKVIADKYCKCLIIDDSFDLQEDFPEFIVQYLDLTRQGNVVENLSVFICELLKK